MAYTKGVDSTTGVCIPLFLRGGCLRERLSKDMGVAYMSEYGIYTCYTLETKIHIPVHERIRKRNMYLHFSRGVGVWLSVFCQKTWGGAYASEYGISTLQRVSELREVASVPLTLQRFFRAI